jgi:hypothetical protein
MTKVNMTAFTVFCQLLSCSTICSDPDGISELAEIVKEITEE